MLSKYTHLKSLRYKDEGPVGQRVSGFKLIIVTLGSDFNLGPGLALVDDRPSDWTVGYSS